MPCCRWVALIHGFWASQSALGAGECGSSAEHPFRQIRKRVGGEGLAGKGAACYFPCREVIISGMVDPSPQTMAHTEVVLAATRGAEPCRVAQGRPDCPAVITNTQHRM